MRISARARLGAAGLVVFATAVVVGAVALALGADRPRDLLDPSPWMAVPVLGGFLATAAQGVRPAFSGGLAGLILAIALATIVGTVMAIGQLFLTL